MMTKLRFSVSGVGLCEACSSGVLFEENAPDNWDTLTDEEKEDAAAEIWYGNVQWNWEETE